MAPALLLFALSLAVVDCRSEGPRGAPGDAGQKADEPLMPPQEPLPAARDPSSEAPPGERNEMPKDVTAVLDWPDRFELFFLDPIPIRPDGESKPKPGTRVFHGYRILGQAQVTAAKTRERIVSLVNKGIRESDGAIGACFEPRHGIHATRAGRTADLVICYACAQIRIYDAERETGGLLTSSTVGADVHAAFLSAGVRGAP